MFFSWSVLFQHYSDSFLRGLPTTWPLSVHPLTGYSPKFLLNTRDSITIVTPPGHKVGNYPDAVLINKSQLIYDCV